MEEKKDSDFDEEPQNILYNIAQLLNSNNNNNNSHELITKIKDLVKNEAKYKARFSSPNKGVLYFNIGAELEEINSGVTKLLGYEFNDINHNQTEIRKKLLDSDGTPYPENSLPLVKAMETGESQPEVEIMIPTKAGHYKWFLSSSDPVYDNHNKLIGALLVLEEITDHKKKESELIKENKKLLFSERAFVQAEKLANVGNWLYDLKTESFTISDGMYRILEIDKESYDGDFEKIARIRMHPDDRNKLEDRLKLAKSGNPLPSVEYRNIFPNGKIKTFRAEASHVILDKEGNPDIIIGVLVDITEQKMKESNLIKENIKLHDSERAFVQVEKLANVGNWLYDLKTKSFTLSDGMYRILEINKATYDGNIEKILYSKVHPDDIRLFEDRLKVATNGNPLSSAEYRVVSTNGNVKIIKAEASDLILDKNGKPDLIIGVMVDITEQRQREKEKLEEQSLQHEKKIETLRLLASETSHNFNNLLAVIYGYIDLAIAEQSDSVYLKNALNSIEKARDLTDQILSFTKDDIVNKEIISIGELLNEKGSYLDNNPSILIDIEVLPDLLPIYGNKSQIGLVFENIIKNAIQSIQKNGSVKIKAENYFNENSDFNSLNDYIKISIQDTGSGMSQEVIDHLYEPFFTTKDNGKGLGLATSYSITKNHGGRIEVDSEESKGSEFNIYLPVANLSIQHPEIEYESKPHIGTGDFIVLEDNKELQPIFKKYLESFGYTAHIKNTGEEILALLKDNSIKRMNIKGMLLVLYSASDKGGKEIINKIRNIYPSLPVFVTSEYTDDPIIRYPREYSFTASIKKPFFKNELEALLNKYLDPNLTYHSHI